MTYAEAQARLESAAEEIKAFAVQDTVEVLAPTMRYSNADPERKQPPPTQEVEDLVAYCNMAAR
eukprot:8281392-Prorocentrum_lima.AAC.1